MPRQSRGSAGVAIERLSRHPFRILVFDWDGTAVAGRGDDPAALRAAIERLLRQNLAIVVVTGTHKGHLERQLSDAIRGPHKRNLYLATNRGSEIFGFDEEGRAVRLWYREATGRENDLLTAAADALHDRLARTGLDTKVIYDRLNRRKVDLIPLAEWADPPKAAMASLLAAVRARLAASGLAGGLAAAAALARRLAVEAGLADPRITSDVKHIEIGLTDKGDSIRWALSHLARPQDIPPAEILVAGDEFGPVAGLPGSDSLMIVPEAEEAVFVSVGPEPEGVPEGVMHLPGGPRTFRSLLADLARRQALPASPFPDPAWLLTEEGFNVAREHEVESLLAIGNGHVGTRASLAEGSALSAPGTYVAGVFAPVGPDGQTPELLPAPDWLGIHGEVNGCRVLLEPGTAGLHRRVLDMREGILWRKWRYQDPEGRRTWINALRLVSLADRHVLFQSLAFRPDNYAADVTLETALEGGAASQMGPFDVATRSAEDGATIAIASWSRLTRAGEDTIAADTAADLPGKTRWRFRAAMDATYRLDRIAVAYCSRDVPDPVEAACRHLSDILARQDAGTVVQAHRQAWEARWRAADARIDGDEAAQRAIRFAGYHLTCAANPEDEHVSIGARGLTGLAYKGHYFWDTEVHMVPYFTLTWPEAARALLRFRHRTLPAARKKARDLGYEGALYPWETTSSGEEATPPFALAPDGQVIPIATRTQAHHIDAAVAHAAWRYWEATGDDRFLAESGAEILFETARFWASRCRTGSDGRCHIDGVVGPDEYHDQVADDAYTNGMAQWNLETALEAASLLEDRLPQAWNDLVRRLALRPAELERWGDVAARMYTGQDPETGLFEQFQGYFDLPDIDLPPFEARSAPPDVLLGFDTIKRSRVIKQADVLMLLFLLPERFSPKAREVNFRFYAPRTGHGSSLSPGVHATIAARLGDLDAAQRYFRQAADVDLANNMGNAAGGVHLGALGSLWQALAFGFGGLGWKGPALEFAPRLPAGWTGIRLRLTWRGRPLEARLGRGAAWELVEVPE